MIGYSLVSFFTKRNESKIKNSKKTSAFIKLYELYDTSPLNDKIKKTMKNNRLIIDNNLHFYLKLILLINLNETFFVNSKIPIFLRR